METPTPSSEPSPAPASVPPVSPPVPPAVSRGHRERWWWLAIFIAVSLIVHLGVVWESRGWHVLGASGAAIATPAPGEIEVALGPLERPTASKVTKPTKAASSTPAPPAPTAPPTHEAPSPEHNKRPSPVEATKIPIRPDRVVSTVKTMSGETMPTRNTPHQHTADVLMPTPATPPPDRQPQVTAIPTPHPVLAPIGVPDAPEQPLELPKVAGGSGTLEPGTIGPRTHAPLPNSQAGEKIVDQKGTAENTTPSGGPTGTGAPIAGASNKLGLTRGIPFGSRTGLSGGSNAGDGLGDNGQPLGVSGGGRDGTPFRFQLSRPTAAKLGLTPAHIIYVLDVSGSMSEDNKITLARAALRQAVSELLPDDSFAFITFSDRPTAYSQTLKPATAFNISTQETNVDLVEPGGDTDLSDALDIALNMSGVTHIFLISDGEPTSGIVDHDELRKHIRTRNPGAAIHISTFALGDGEQFEGVQLLRQIAAENAGEYRYVNDKGR